MACEIFQHLLTDYTLHNHLLFPWSVSGKRSKKELQSDTDTFIRQYFSPSSYITQIPSLCIKRSFMVIGKKKSKIALKFNIHTTTCPPVASHGVSSILYLKQADGQWKKRINKSPFMFYGKGVLSLCVGVRLVFALKLSMVFPVFWKLLFIMLEKSVQRHLNIKGEINLFGRSIKAAGAFLQI